MAAFLEATVRQARVTERAGHRPWPLPAGPWVQGQTWEELAFLHWPVDAAAVRALLPGGLELDLHAGEAWVGIVPFRIAHLRVRGLPPVPGVSTFPELNVRTYVTRGGKPGVWFFSLDAANRLFVRAGRRVFRLPYRHARMRCERRGGEIEYASAAGGATFAARYRGDGPSFRAEPRSLEAFLVERYCLYAADGARILRADIHHLPWELRRGTADIDANTLSPVPLPPRSPHVLFAARQDMVVWPPAEAP
jgi:uncharacterized protein YqjF (DUF2071 family)